MEKGELEITVVSKFIGTGHHAVDAIEPGFICVLLGLRGKTSP